VYDADAAKETAKSQSARRRYEAMPEKDLEKELKRLERAMLDAAKDLEFEKAADLRDRLHELKQAMFGVNLPLET
jgi:excinuclease ABC subunit B